MINSKKSLLTNLFLFGIFTANAQQLTINETISYINESLAQGTKISYTQDGMLEYSSFDYTGKPSIWKHHITDIVQPTKVEYTASKWRVYLKTPQGGIVVGLHTDNGDKYSAEKLLNALNYFFTLAMNNVLEQRSYDNDPFAPGNYNPHATSIKSTLSNSSIPLEKQGGVYHIDVTIGTTIEKFILDSGASEVLINQALERKLINDNILKKEHYLTPALYRIADGSIIEQRRLIIPSVTIGDFTIENVHASVGAGNVPLLLGKSVLDKFSKWSINNLTLSLDVTK